MSSAYRSVAFILALVSACAALLFMSRMFFQLSTLSSSMSTDGTFAWAATVSDPSLSCISDEETSDELYFQSCGGIF